MLQSRFRPATSPQEVQDALLPETLSQLNLEQTVDGVTLTPLANVLLSEQCSLDNVRDAQTVSDLLATTAATLRRAGISADPIIGFEKGAWTDVDGDETPALYTSVKIPVADKITA